MSEEQREERVAPKTDAEHAASVASDLFDAATTRTSGSPAFDGTPSYKTDSEQIVDALHWLAAEVMALRYARYGERREYGPTSGCCPDPFHSRPSDPPAEFEESDRVVIEATGEPGEITLKRNLVDGAHDYTVRVDGGRIRGQFKADELVPEEFVVMGARD